MITSEIYTKIDEVLSIQQLGVLPIIVAASTIAFVVLLILLKKWKFILAGGVKRRTQQLEDNWKTRENEDVRYTSSSLTSERENQE